MIEPVINAKHGSGSGPTWACPICKKKYQKKGMAQCHILNKHKGGD